MTQFTANEVRAWFEGMVEQGLVDELTLQYGLAFADLLEAREKAVPVGMLRIGADASNQYGKTATFHYADACMDLSLGDHEVFPHPAPSDAERLADETALRYGWAYSYSGSNLYGDDGELQDNAAFPHIDWLRDSVQELHQKVAKRGAAKLAAHSAQAQPPAASVTDAMVEDGCMAWNKSAGLGYAVADRDCMRAAIEAAIAAQENPND